MVFTLVCNYRTHILNVFKRSKCNNIMFMFHLLSPFFSWIIMDTVIIILQSGSWSNFSHTIYLCVLILCILYFLKLIPNDRFLSNFSVAILFTKVVARRKSPDKYFFISCFDVDVCHEVWIVDSCRVSEQTTYWTLDLY